MQTISHNCWPSGRQSTRDSRNKKLALPRLVFTAAARCLDYPLNATGRQVAAELRRYTRALAS
jgi:hypothetical protein